MTPLNNIEGIDMSFGKGKVRTGIVGAGVESIATGCHIPGSLGADNMELVALCDINPGVKNYAEKYGVKAYLDYKEMLADPEIDMVQVATPDWVHCEQAKMALAAGKHALLQKPPCLTLKEVESLRKAAAQSGRLLKVIQHQRETALSRTIKARIDDGSIGELREIKIRFLGRRYPIQNLKSPYLTEACGGVWVHNGMHWLDEAFFYAEALPESVQVFTARNPEGAPQVLGEGPNYWSAIFKMGRVAFHFEYNAALTADSLPAGMHRALIGTKGELRQECGSQEISLYQAGQDKAIPCPVLDDAKIKNNEMVDAFRMALEKFGRQILGGPLEPPFIEDSLTMMEALLKGVEAKGECVKLDTRSAA